MKLINKSLIDLENCFQTIFNLKIEETELCLKLIDSFISKKSVRLISNIYSFLTSVHLFTDSKTIRFKNEEIKYDSNTFYYINKITSGSYGDISNCIFNNNECIVKNIKFEKIDYTNKNYMYLLNSEFLTENIIHLILFCMFNLMILCSKHSIPNCIPQIHNIINATNNSNLDTVIVIMEKLDIDIFTFFNKKHSFKEEISLISQVAYNLYNLQKCFNSFMHRDFHCANIMLKKMNNVQKIKIITDDVKFDVYSKYQTFIIDFGMCFVDFKSKCKNIKMDKSHIYVEGSYENHRTYNKGHDLRLFLASIYYWRNKNISSELKLLLKKMFEPYEQIYKFKNYKNKNQPTFYFYEDVLKVQDINFYPENFLYKINKLI
jgi:hypothetical protein